MDPNFLMLACTLCVCLELEFTDYQWTSENCGGKVNFSQRKSVIKSLLLVRVRFTKFKK